MKKLSSMKKLLGMLFVSCLFMVNAQAQSLWSEGTHYTVIAENASEDKKITEFFSFWCPHCYNFEPIVAEIKKKKPAEVEFEKVHVNFMRSAGPDVQDAVTKAMMIGKALNKEEAVIATIFSHIHKDRKLIAGESDIKALFAKVGISADDFDKASKSFAVNGQFKKNNKIVQQFRRHVNGVPNFIVNEKYQANFQRGMTPDDMADLIVYLSSLD